MPAFLFQRNNKVIISIEEMKKNVVSPFIEMIWEIVSDPQTDNIIAWSPNGTSFCITDSKLFADDILTTSFKHGNISSFVRQVILISILSSTCITSTRTRPMSKTWSSFINFFGVIPGIFFVKLRDLLIGIKRKPS